MKTKSNSRKNIKNMETLISDKIIWITLLSLMILVPNILMAKTIENKVPFISEYLKNENVTDIFSYWKLFFLVAGLTILLGVFTYKVMVDKVRLDDSKINYINLSILFFFSISMLLSPLKMISLFGTPSYLNGFFTNFCMIFLFFILSYTIFEEKKYLYLYLSISFFIVINFLLGLLHFYGINTLDSESVSFFIGLIEKVKFTSGSYISSTFTNPNHISGVSGVLFSLTYSFSLFHEKKKIRLLSILLSILTIITAITSLSSSGFLTIMFFFLTITIYAIVSKRKSKRLILINSLTALVVIISSVFILDVKNDMVWQETIGNFGISNPYANTIDNKLNKQGELASPMDTKSIDSVFDNNSFPEIPKLAKPGYGPLSGRLYIWEKTIDVTKERLLFGHGFDTLIYTFDQYDLKKIENLYNPALLVDKPHSIFLEWLYGAGLFSLFSILSLIFLQGCRFIRFLIKKNHNPFLIAFGFSSFSFLFQGLVNDSEIGSSFLFWVLFGLLASIMSKENKLIDIHKA